MFNSRMKKAVAIVFAASLLVNLSGRTVFAAGEPGQNAGPVDVTVDCGKQHQIIRGLGSCLKGWGSPARDPEAKWQMDPKGLELYAKDAGFAVARVPVDRWVIEGESPDMYKIPSSLLPEMKDDPAKITYDKFKWERTGRAACGEEGKISRGIRWTQELHKLNPDMLFTASVWSPPHWMKEAASKGPGAKFEWSKNGASSCGGRLAPKYYKHYAHFLAQYCLAMEKKFQVPLYSISIQNELSFYEPYDSCLYTPQEFHDVVGEVAAVFKELGVKTKIMGPEDMTKFPDRLWSFVKPVLADAKTKDSLAIICSHGYADGIQISLGAGDALKLWDMMKDTGKEYWMTETGGGPANWEKKEGGESAKGGATNALDNLASRIHNSIVIGNASLWTLWQFMTSEPDAEGMVLTPSMDEFKPTKKYYIQKHYAKFIPPGTHRVETSKDAGGILAGAFADKDKGVLTLVLQNHNDAETTVKIKVSGGPAASSLSAYVTDKDRNCEKTADVPVRAGAIELKMSPRSLVTLTTKPETK
ncbi:MAG: hypothetical protein HZA50_06610 [Planctomycetes bacterium]|nr:hypothetical protein [Planctomycetota bacterium]